jgi:uroporphyrinogen-III synthase
MSALAGKRVLVTRAAEDQQELAALLAARGAEPVALPCIELADPLDDAPLRTELQSLRAARGPDFLVLASPHAADRFLSRVDPHDLAGAGAAQQPDGAGRKRDARAFGPRHRELAHSTRIQVDARDRLSERVEGPQEPAAERKPTRARRDA